MTDNVACIDLLGFSNMIELNDEKARKVLSDFYEIAYQNLQDNNDIKGILFSDSLLAYSNNKSVLIKCICKIYRECIKKNNDYLDDPNFFLLPRGGISAGLIKIEQRIELPNLRKNFVVSPALVHSSKMEKAISGGRLLVAAKKGTSEEIVWDERNSSTILYMNKAIELWKGYKYYDCLYLRDLDNDPDSQKGEIQELLKIIIELMSNQNLDTRALQHHIGTLRIGLLSYSQYIEATTTDNLIEKLFTDFKEDKYWMLWLALIEALMQSPDSWAVSSKEIIIDFYKEVSISKGWSNLLIEINKPNQSFVKSRVQEFINEMNIKTVN